MTAFEDHLRPPAIQGTSTLSRVQHYDDRSVFDHPEHGRREIAGPIRDFWMKALQDCLGFPISDEENAQVGDRPMRVIRFERGSIYRDLVTNQLFEVEVGAGVRDTYKYLAFSLYGRWDMPFEPGVVGVHAALFHTNQVLLWSYEDSGSSDPIPTAGGEWSLLDLRSGRQVIKKQKVDRNQFCGGQCLLGDGRLLVVGGERHSVVNHKSVSLFDPEARSWLLLRPDLKVGRWYPTVATTSADMGIAVGGDDAPEQRPFEHFANPTAEYVRADGWTIGPYSFDAGITPRPDKDGASSVPYPFVFVLPGAKLFVHFVDESRILSLGRPLDFAGAEKLVEAEELRTSPFYGTAVLLPLRPGDDPPYRARVMLIGGLIPETLPMGRNSCAILDLESTPHQWKPAARMKHPRFMPDAVLLPDGKVLVVNGSAQGKEKPIYNAEVYDPATNTWTELAPMMTPRLYHSTALLLPDARVLVAGTDRVWNPAPFNKAYTQLEAFSAPYLFQGPRPNILLAPKEVKHGEVFEVAADPVASIQSAALIRNGSCTHSFNSDQRYVELRIVRRLDSKRWWTWVRKPFVGLFPQFLDAEGLELQAPPTPSVAPPGYYMLFLLSDKGVPSVAEFVRLKQSLPFWASIVDGIATAFRSIRNLVGGSGR